MTVTASTPNPNAYVRGVEETSTIPSPANTMINPGDLIAQVSGVAQNASAFTWTTNLATTQANFRQAFLGVALDQKDATDPSTRNILVATSGIFKYPCAALGSQLNIGQLVGPDKDVGSNLLDQQLVAVTGFADAIGTLAEVAPAGATQLVVYLRSWLIFSQLTVAT